MTRQAAPAEKGYVKSMSLREFKTILPEFCALAGHVMRKAGHIEGAEGGYTPAMALSMERSSELNPPRQLLIAGACVLTGATYDRVGPMFQRARGTAFQSRQVVKEKYAKELDTFCREALGIFEVSRTPEPEAPRNKEAQIKFGASPAVEVIAKMKKHGALPETIRGYADLMGVAHA